MKNLCYLSALAATAVLVSCKDSKSDGVVLAKGDGLPKPGIKLTTSRSLAMKGGEVKIVASGQNMEGTMDMTDSETADIEFLSADKVKYTIKAGEKVQAMKLNGQNVPNEPQPSPLLGKTVIYTKSGSKWTGALESGSPTPPQAKEIEKYEKKLEKSSDAAVYGSAARKVGETWTVDGANIPFAGNDGDTKGTLKLTFKGVETYEGRKCARLEGTLDITGKTDADQGGQSISMKGDTVILRAIEEMIDVKQDFKGKMEMNGTIPGGTMSMSGDITVGETNKIN
ncbi:MAG: hypothetical protein QM755_14935 [Luteolibacter sp.]